MWQLPRALLLCLLSGSAAAQGRFPTPPNNAMTNSGPIDAVQTGMQDLKVFTMDSPGNNLTSLGNPNSSVSKLDLKAPGRARHEYEKGYELLMRKDLPGAIEHLAKATAIYPSFVAAHSALGAAYLRLGKNEEARGEFAQAAALDDHLPNLYMNLGCAQLALKQYPEAEETLKKASSIAPLDVATLAALAYAEYLNQDYPAVIATAGQVHLRRHASAVVVHYLAAGAWEARDNLTEAQREMETGLQEDSKSGSSDRYRQMLERIKAEQVSRAEAKLHPPEPVTVSYTGATSPTSEEALQQARRLLQDVKEKNQIAEAEAEPDSVCVKCGTSVADGTEIASKSSLRLSHPTTNFPAATFRSSVDEVAVFFAATDHGKSVTNLTVSEIGVRDNDKPPETIRGFRNESQLPLRLGLIIDTSNSIRDRFSFEQAAAIEFLQKVVTHENDLAFVVGVSNSVLLVQDFTADQTLPSRAVSQLAPGGGTALWDAVAFGADKLGNRPEIEPVARILVVISDGQDNSSDITLKQAIESAQRGEVAVYTVSTREEVQKESADATGDRALKALSDLTGGAAFTPGSVRRLNGSLEALQEVIRGRYLVSYKPASFERNGRYRPIDIKAEKDGRRLKVYARKGYYAAIPQASSGER
jgi:Ca-activated chloride channel family protein